jgi:hypothetical protein
MFRSTEIALGEYRRRFPDYADDIDAHLQDFRIWFAWGALRAGKWGDAAALIGQCTATRPLVAPLRFSGMVLEMLRGRLFRRLHLMQQPMPLYTGTIW